MDGITIGIIAAGFAGAVALAYFRGRVPADLKARVESGELQLVDVREPNEWAAGHLQAAVSVPLSSLRAGTVPDLPKDKPLALHCASGMRVKAAKPIFEKMGFKEVTALSPGYAALSKTLK